MQAGNPEFERQLLEAGREIPDIVGFGMAPSLALFIMTWGQPHQCFYPALGRR
ncbi:MAG: hypothetical protein M5U34_48340 [Chloroflexi bacterium]|nr:hypothetical protein [Chloroflexota bacterium]